MAYDKIQIPSNGEPITGDALNLNVPNQPIIPCITGDGIGLDITPTMRKVVDGAVQKAYGTDRAIAWMDIYAGEKANELYGNYMPEETFEALREFKVGIKGPLTTPVGGGFRSLNVTIRHVLDLYACVRPVRWFQGVPSPVKSPEKLNVILYRENTEDVYAGIEWESDSTESNAIIDYLTSTYGVKIRKPSGIGVKPISKFGSSRIVRAALRYAVKHSKKTLTLVHKGNIMKFTEGAFKEWGFEVAKSEFRDQIVTEEETWNGASADGKVLVKDRIADAMFQQVLLRPDEYDVIALPNLNGDYLSDACAAQVGGLGLAPGANIGDEVACFEATHGTAPKYTGMDKVNPGSLILSAVMMLEHIGWQEAADLVIKGIETTISKKTVTYDLERQMEGAKLLKCSEFGQAIVDNM